MIHEPNSWLSENFRRSRYLYSITKVKFDSLAKNRFAFFFFLSQLKVKPVYKRAWLKRQWFRTWLDFSDCLSKAKIAIDLFFTHFWTHFSQSYASDLLDQTEFRKIDVCILNFNWQNCCFCLSNQTIDFQKFKIAKRFFSTGFPNAFFWVTTVMFLPWRPELKNQHAFERFPRNFFLVLDLSSKCW